MFFFVLFYFKLFNIIPFLELDGYTYLDLLEAFTCLITVLLNYVNRLQRCRRDYNVSLYHVITNVPPNFQSDR